MMNDEQDELERLGLEAPEDVSDLNEDEKKSKAFEKKSSIPLLPVLNERKANNVDLPEHEITPDELLQRLKDQEEREAKLAKRREEIIIEDREHQEAKWQSKVPYAFGHADVTSLPTELSAACTEWLLLDRKEQHNQILFGASGRGKTFTAYAIAKELFINRQKIYISEATELLDSLRPNAENPIKLNVIKTVPYLMIDDLGTEKISEWVLEQWFMIFDFRWKNALPGIFTTNLKSKDILDRYGERISTRIFDKAVLTHITGANRRSAK